MKTELDPMDWTRDALVYQINLRALAHREPRNALEAATEAAPADSALAHVTTHISTLKDLGVNTLYLMPPYPMGLTDRKGIGSPYSIRDFRAVDPEYGTDEDLADFVRAARACGLRLLAGLSGRGCTWICFRRGRVQVRHGALHQRHRLLG